MRNVFETIISDMINHQRTEYGISSPYIHVRMKWDWRNKFQGFTMIFKSRAKKDTSDLVKNFANNFSYVMAPVENEIVDIGKALTAILGKDLGGEKRSYTREQSLLVAPLQSSESKPERKDAKKKSAGGLEHPQPRDRTIAKKLSKFSTEGSKISGEIMPSDQVTQRRRIKKNNTDICRINWMKNQLPSEDSSGLNLGSDGKLGSSSINLMIPDEADAIGGLSMQRNISRFTEKQSTNQEPTPAVGDVSKTFLAFCMTTDHLKDTYVMEYLNMKNEKEKPDRTGLKNHTSRPSDRKITTTTKHHLSQWKKGAIIEYTLEEKRMNLVAHMDFENRVPGPDEITKCNLSKHNYREWNLNI